MVIFTGGKSVAINSPRHLTLRHARQAVLTANEPSALTVASLQAEPEEPPTDPTPPLAPGQAQLHSFWAPGLEAGKKHEIKVTQDIKAPTDERTLRLEARQDFFVDAPQFVLPEGSVYSTYPPPGYSDDRRILPHVVLTDPHLPWERIGSPSAEKIVDTRNKVPWLALFTFAHDELLLKPDALGSVKFKQSPTLSIKMKVGDLLKIGNVATPIDDDSGPDVEEANGEFIFLKPDLFKSFFSTFDESNMRQVPEKPNVNQYKYLSHVRKINTKGMAVAGVEDFGIFSVVVSNRCGPLNNPTAASISVHLVSIEGVEDMMWPGSDKDYVGLCSLHSWNYTVVPPGQLNVRDAFVHLGKELDVLRPLETVFKPLQTKDRVSARLGDRLQDGYSLVKYRVQTGEQTVALYRGPFTPTRVSHHGQLDKCSNSGQDLQILDKEIGMMDISYSVAWQIGRTLALGDRAFVAALARLRSIIRKKAMKECKTEAVISAGTEESLRSRLDLLSSLPETIERLQNIQLPTPPSSNQGDDVEFRPGGVQKRWYRPQLSKKQYPSLSYASDPIQDTYLQNAVQAVLDLSMGKDGRVYDETNDPVSTDWMVVQSWIVDRMFLDRVPAHYLISDPSHLPPESLRFFYIDRDWVDAMVDGALSLANHMGQDLDRAAIKHGLNRFLDYLPPNQTHRPQIPTYGFYLRSDLVTMYPDLRVTTRGVDTGRAPLLLHEIVADGVMIGMFDRIPGKELDALVFTQPPHQQRFAAGSYLEGDKLKFSLRRQYTVDQKYRDKDGEQHKALRYFELEPNAQNNWFVWSTVPKTPVGGQDNSDPNADLRILRLPHFAEEQRQILQDNMGEFTNDEDKKQKYFDDSTSNSALIAMQLNDPYYDLIVSLKKEEEPGKKEVAIAALASLQAEAEEPSQELRNLQFMAPSTVPRVHDSEDDDDEDQEEHAESLQVTSTQSSTDSEDEDWSRDESYEPRPHALRHGTGPHVRALVTESLPDAMSSDTPHGVPILTEFTAATAEGSQAPVAMLSLITAPRSDLGRPAGPPEYDCDVYSLQKSWIMQNKDNLEQDLVFSVLVRNNEYSSYNLIEFDIAIELGAEDEQKWLMENYTGPGARMLSNLRFNALTSFTTMPDSHRKCLLLRLLPRSSLGWINIKQVKEISFMLTLAKLNEFKDTTRFTLHTSAYYIGGHEKDPITDHFDIWIARDNGSSS
ncbi:hypothetical protein EDB80DRAFT_893391 [Ilyonectria destructans]|nr:hypothetical protein EDB80DRAFT_893391 [Ilyonectria destructans]